MKHTLLRVGCLLLMGLSLQGCGLFKSDLDKLLETKECQECDLSGANLTEARLDGANLTGASLKEANLTDAVLFAANLDGEFCSILGHIPLDSFQEMSGEEIKALNDGSAMTIDTIHETQIQLAILTVNENQNFHVQQGLSLIFHRQSC